MPIRKILHINDVASVGSSMVRAQNAMGMYAELRELPKPLADFRFLFMKIPGFWIRLRGARKMIRYAEEQGFDLLHIHYVSSAIWFLSSRIPIVLHAHGSDVRLSRWNIGRHLVNWLCCRKAKLVLYSTPDMKPYMRRYVSGARFLPNPFNMEDFTPSPLPREKYILLFASLAHIKGADIALDAIAEIRKRHPQVEFRAFAGGPYEARARQLGLTVIQQVPRPQLPSLVQRAAFVLGQFRVGAIGLSEIETLACGRTIACHFKYPLIYGDPPPFVEAHTAPEIVDIVEKVLADPNAYAEREKGAREWVRKHHSAQKVCGKLLNMYEDVLTKTRIFMVVPSYSSWIMMDINILKAVAKVRVANSLRETSFRAIFSQWKYLRRADLCYCWFGSVHHLPYLILAWLMRKKIIIVAGGYDVARLDSIKYGAFSRSLFSRIIRRWIFSFADLILAVSKYNQTQISKNLRASPDRVRMIYLSAGQAVNTELKSWAERPRQVAILLSAADDDAMVKGVDRIPELCGCLPDIQFKLAGRFSPEVAASLGRKRPANLEMLGFLPFQSPAFVDLLNNSRVILSTSRTESFGAAMVDGAALGCVPVSFAVGALPEVIEGIGKVVPLENVADLALAVREVIDRQNVDVRAIHQKALSRFPLERRTDALFKTLVDMRILHSQPQKTGV